MWVGRRRPLQWFHTHIADRLLVIADTPRHRRFAIRRRRHPPAAADRTPWPLRSVVASGTDARLPRRHGLRPLRLFRIRARPRSTWCCPPTRDPAALYLHPRLAAA